MIQQCPAINTREKIVHNCHLKCITPETKQREPASLPSTKHKALDITPDITAPLFKVYMSVAEKRILAIQTNNFNQE